MGICFFFLFSSPSQKRPGAPSIAQFCESASPIELAQWSEDGWDVNHSPATELSLRGEVRLQKRLILMPLLLLLFSFRIFCPKIACQAPKSLNPKPSNNIHVAF
jgi:hypothetical protein